MPRRPELLREDLEALEKELFDRIVEDLQDRQGWLEKRVRSFEDWLNPNPEVKKTPWEGASNITPPFIAGAVRNFHARLMGAIFNSEPLVHALPMPVGMEDSEEANQAARVREQLLNEQLRSEIPDFYRSINTALLDKIVQGTSFSMVWYERSRESFAEWLSVEAFDLIGGTEVPRTDQQILEELISDIRATRTLGDHAYEVDHLEDGDERMSRVTIDRDDPELPDSKISVTIERERIERGIRIRTLDIEDLVFPASATSLQRPDCHRVARLLRMRAQEIRKKKTLGRFNLLDAEDLEKLEKFAARSVGGSVLPQETTAVKEAIDAYTGIELVKGLSGIEAGHVLVVQYHYPWDINGDGLEEDLLIHWIPELRKIAQIDYSTVYYRHGKRPYVPWVFMPLTGRLYGPGLAEILEDIQAEAATIFNQMNDRENLINNPVKMVTPNAGIAPSAFKNVAPGTVLTVRGLDRLGTLSWNINPMNAIPIFQFLSAFAERLSTGDIASGVQPSRPNAPRTARGTLALIAESNVLIDTHVMNAQWISLQELISQIDALNEQYDPERTFFMAGEAAPVTVNRDHFRHRLKFYFTGNTANTNIQVKQAMAQLLFQTLITLPLFTGAFIQMPEISVRAMYRLAENFVRAHTPGKDPRLHLPPVEEFIQVLNEVQEAQVRARQEGEARAREREEEEREDSVLSLLQEGAGQQAGVSARG